MRVSFDYWGTMTLNEFQQEARKLLKAKNEVFLITRGKYIDKAREIAEECGIKPENVISTNGEDKGPIMKEMAIDIHYDDDQEQINRIKAVHSGTYCIRVNLAGRRSKY